ncbi:MAG TPA: hypothetical protein VF665_17605 [Longimicrobium sp.]|jgi:hypothetical protein|uniref:hypothetical protein n=1 Tax=Longimicrobium sp. TaxID=2029185 RepID=UPI002EDA2574
MTNKMLIARVALILAVTPVAYGCRTAAAVGAGAGAATMVNQNADALVDAPIGTVERRTRSVLAGMGMTLRDVAYEDNATEREFEARSGDNVAHVKLEAEGQRTKVGVSYRRGRMDYSKEEATRILNAIQNAR